MNKIDAMRMVEDKEYHDLAKKIIESGDIELLALVMKWIELYAKYEGGLEIIKWL